MKNIHFPLIGILISLCGLRAQTAAPVQTYYLSMPEDQLLDSLISIESGSTAAAPVSPVINRISIAAIADNTLIYYDQGENGYDPVIQNPANVYSAGNPGGTQIWGDGDPSNGAPPGVPSDLINAGTVIVLEASVPVPYVAGTYPFGGGDKIASSKPIAVVRAGWASASDTLLAGANELFDTVNWGTEYRMPVGEDTAGSQSMFEYTGVMIMAGPGGAEVQIDADADTTFETTVTLTEGQSHHVDGGLLEGARIVADAAVQVDAITGDIASNYESRFFRVSPVELWTESYVTPVSTQSGDATTVWLFNPTDNALAVDYTTRDTGGVLATTTLSVPANGSLAQILPEGFGGKFEAAAPFYAVSTTDSNDGDAGNQASDWGFSLIPQGSATRQVLAGLGIGRDPTSGTNPSENGSPLWVTPVGNGDTPVTVYVDYDADPSTGGLTDPFGNQYDVALSLRELEVEEVFDPDGDQTGMLLYTLEEDVKLAVAWGQDPTVASPGAPGLDMGTGVPPLPSFVARKESVLIIDNDNDGFISPGDVLEYEVVIENTSRFPVPDMSLQDTLPPSVEYLPNTTFFDQGSGPVAIPDDVSPASPFPLDESPYDLNATLPVSGEWSVTYEVLVKDFEDLDGLLQIENAATVNAVDIVALSTSVELIRGKIGDFVWFDSDLDGIRDAGEPGINGVTVRLLDVNGDPVLDDHNDPVTTVTANDVNGDPGFYLLQGIPGGDYVLEFEPPPQYRFTLQDQGTDEELDSDVIPATGRTDVFSLGGGETLTDRDAGLVDATVIGDGVWLDVDGDGLQDPGEPGLNGVTVYLLDSAGDPVLDGFGDPVTAVTANDGGGDPGFYTFGGLDAGTYRVEFELPADHAFTTQNADGQGVLGAANSDADPVDGLTPAFTLGTGISTDQVDAGLLQADLAVDKTVSSSGVNEGGVATFVVTLNNLGPTLATGVEVEDTLPSGLSFDAAVPSQGTFDAGSGVWTVGTVAANAAATLEITATVDAGTLGQTLTNTAVVTASDMPDPVAGNDEDTAAVSVSGLAISKTSDAAGSINHGDTLTYTVQVENIGAATTSDVRVEDVLPPGVTYVANSISAALSPDPPAPGPASVQVDTAGAGTFTVPAGVTELTVEAWGGGGGGAASGTNNAGGAGGGGAYARLDAVTTTPGAEIDYFVGAGGGLPGAGNPGNPGQDSWFITDTTLLAAGGAAGGIGQIYLGGAGGTVANSIGDQRYAGGSGGEGLTTTKPEDRGGGGGGGSAFANADGGDGQDGARNDPGAGGVGEGNGGDGGQSGVIAGEGGFAPGGGGGGCGGAGAGAGAVGRIVVSYTTPSYEGITNEPPNTTLASGWTLDPGMTLTVTYQVTVDSDAVLTEITNTASATSADHPDPIEDSVTDSVNGAVVGDFVWVDTNGNGVQDGGEAGLEGVSVSLRDDLGDPVLDPAGDPLVATTDAAGAYSFSGLPPGDYRVEFGLPGAYVFTEQNADGQGVSGGVNSDADESTGLTPVFSVTSGQTFDQADAGAYLTGELSGTILVDTDGNGVGDAPHVGVTVELLDDQNGVVAGTTTDANGFYSFGDVAPGDYRVRQTVPTGFTAIDDVDGGDLTLNGDVTVISLSSGGNIVDQDFTNQELLPPVAVDDLSLGNSPGAVTLNAAANDSDPNGDLDPSQVRFAGTASPGDALSVSGEGTWTVDGSGNVTFTPEVGFTSDPTPVIYTIFDTTGLESNEATLTVDYVPVAADDEDLDNSIGDAVTVDVTANDTDGDSVDPATVQIVGTPAPGDSRTVSGEGTWSVNGSTGEITFTPEAGYTGNPTPIGYTVEDNEGNTSNVAEVTVTYDPSGELSGTILVDTDGNGVGDAPHVGVTVELLDDQNGVVAGTTTDANGFYSFGDVAPGDYRVRQTVPTGFTAIDDVDGGDLTLNGDVTLITLAPGQEVTGQDFANTQYGVLEAPEFCLDSGGTLDGGFDRPGDVPANVSYKLEYAVELGNPTNWDGTVTLGAGNTTVVDNGDGTETVTVGDVPSLTGLTDGRGFVRVRVELDADGDNTADEVYTSAVSGWEDTDFVAACRTYNNPFLSCTPFRGTVDTVSGQELTFTDSVPAPGAGRHYVEVTSGDHEGQRFDIAAVGANQLTLENDADLCAETPPFNTLAGAAPATLAGDDIVVRRHRTLNELFPVDEMTADNDQALADQISLWTPAGFRCYFLFANGGSPKWVEVGDENLTDAGDRVIPPGQGVFVNSRSAKTLRAYGQVRENDFVRPLCAGNNLVGGGYPVDESPVSRGMTVADSFTGNAYYKSADQFLLWKGDDVDGQQGYRSYYLTDFYNPERWVMVGDVFRTDRKAEVLFPRDQAALYRRESDLHSFHIRVPWTGDL